jgi:hypothetical protein
VKTNIVVKTPHHVEGLVNPKVRTKSIRFLVLDTPEHVESENIKFKLGHHQLFLKRDFHYIKCG